MKLQWIKKGLAPESPLVRTKQGIAPASEPGVVHLYSSSVVPQSPVRGENLEELASTSNIRHLEAHGAGMFNHARRMTIKDLTAYELEQLQLRVNRPSPGSEGSKVLQQNISCQALHDGGGRFDNSPCYTGTHVKAIKDVMKWILKGPVEERVLCITGPLGSGKTALMQTLCNRCSGMGLVLASWFFSVRDNTRKGKAHLAPTIAYQMGVLYPQLQIPIHLAIEADLGIFEKELQYQLKKLVIEPWRSSFAPRTPDTQCLVLFIDALDECLEEERDQVMDTLTTELTKEDLPFKILFSARPDPNLANFLSQKHLASIIVRHIDLLQYDLAKDLRHYLQQRLEDIRKNSYDSQLLKLKNLKWPTKQDIKTLVKAANSNFWYPVILLKYLSNPRRSQVEDLNDIVEWAKAAEYTKPNTGLDSLLQGIFAEAQWNLHDCMKISSDSLDVVRVFLTAILFPESTLTEVGLFIRRPALDMRRIVRDLQSFIVLVHQGIIEEETGMPAVKLWIPRVLLEFLSDPARCGHLFVPMKDIQADVLMCALSWLPIASDEDLVSFLKDAGSPSKPAIRLALDIWCRDGVELVASDSLDTCLITPFEKLSKAGTWTKFIRAFENVQSNCCRCRNRERPSKLASQMIHNIYIYREATKGRIAELPEEEQAAWKTYCRDMDRFVTALWDFLEKGSLEGHQEGCDQDKAKDALKAMKMTPLPFPIKVPGDASC